MRLACRYADPDNSVAELQVEVLEKEGWEVFELGTHSAGFLIFVYAVFNCQHMYMRLNCAERGLMLDTSKGHIEVETTADWVITRLTIGFSGKLKSGSPSTDDIGHIIDRMRHCPVSTNLNVPAEGDTTLELG
jgi:hypothetical protein